MQCSEVRKHDPRCPKPGGSDTGQRRAHLTCRAQTSHPTPASQQRHPLAPMRMSTQPVPIFCSAEAKPRPPKDCPDPHGSIPSMLTPVQVLPGTNHSLLSEPPPLEGPATPHPPKRLLCSGLPLISPPALRFGPPGLPCCVYRPPMSCPPKALGRHRASEAGGTGKEVKARGEGAGTAVRGGTARLHKGGRTCWCHRMLAVMAGPLLPDPWAHPPGAPRVCPRESIAVRPRQPRRLRPGKEAFEHPWADLGDPGVYPGVYPGFQTEFHPGRHPWRAQGRCHGPPRVAAVHLFPGECWCW